MNKDQQLEQAGRVRFVGCRLCGTTDTTLYNDGSQYICRSCRDTVSKLDTKKGEVKNAITGQDAG